jgi:hypothetical protein
MSCYDNLFSLPWTLAVESDARATARRSLAQPMSAGPSYTGARPIMYRPAFQTVFCFRASYAKERSYHEAFQFQRPTSQTNTILCTLGFNATCHFGREMNCCTPLLFRQKLPSRSPPSKDVVAGVYRSLMLLDADVTYAASWFVTLHIQIVPRDGGREVWVIRKGGPKLAVARPWRTALTLVDSLGDKITFKIGPLPGMLRTHEDPTFSVRDTRRYATRELFRIQRKT